MNLITPLKGILFDFDGLIVDTETAIYQAWQNLHQDYGKELDLETWAGYVGKSIDEIDPVADFLNSLEGDFDPREMRQEITRRENLHVNKTEVLPGVREVLQQARELGLSLGIVSSSDQDWVEFHLHRLDLEEFFQSTSTSDEVEQAKPDPALYRLGLKKLNLEKERTLVLEDSPNGVLAAKRAGLYCIAVPNPLTSRLPFIENGGQPDQVLDSLEEFDLDLFMRQQE